MWFVTYSEYDDGGQFNKPKSCQPIAFKTKRDAMMYGIAHYKQFKKWNNYANNFVIYQCDENDNTLTSYLCISYINQDNGKWNSFIVMHNKPIKQYGGMFAYRRRGDE